MSKSKRQRKASAWVQRHNRDVYVRKARQQGLRARAAFKLQEIDAKYGLINAADVVVDVGAAPGSWSQYASQKVGHSGKILAVDLLPLAAIENVRFIQGDFTQADTQAHISAAFDDMGIAKADLVLSDMAVNLSGIASIDQARAGALLDSLVGFCQHSLKPGGHLLCKLFHGESTATARQTLQQWFTRVRVIKPQASRASSKEIFFCGQGYAVAARTNTAQ